MISANLDAYITDFLQYHDHLFVHLFVKNNKTLLFRELTKKKKLIFLLLFMCLQATSKTNATITPATMAAITEEKKNLIFFKQIFNQSKWFTCNI